MTNRMHKALIASLGAMALMFAAGETFARSGGAQGAGVAASRARLATPQAATRSGSTAGTLSGPPSAASIMVRMARPSWMPRRRAYRTISAIPIPTTSPGIGPIVIRRMSCLPTGPMCRAAVTKPSRFPAATARSTPSISRGATSEGAGWVERSDTHQRRSLAADGFRFALPILQSERPLNPERPSRLTASFVFRYQPLSP